MTIVKTSKVIARKEELVDDLTTKASSADYKAETTEKNENVKNDEDAADDARLAALKARMAAKQKAEEENVAIEVSEEKEVPPVIVEEKKRSIRFGVIGSGQAGSRLCEAFVKRGYPGVALNTAIQDLKHINIPEANKLLLEYGLGGSAKDMTIGSEAAEANRDAINELVNDKLSDCQLLLFCTSLGGGSGAGSAETVVSILSQMNRPVAVITVLPLSTDDVQTKDNALKTLAKFTQLVNARKIDNLIVVDNARIETIYSDVSQLNFFNVSNEAIVDPIDAFNTLSSMASSVKGLDPTEFGRLFTDGQGLTVYGSMEVSDYEDDTGIASAVIDNMTNNLLASGFDLKKAKYVGAIFVANEKTWTKIANSSVNYAMAMVGDLCPGALAVFKGIYSVDSNDNTVKVYSMFSGLSLPDARIEQLKAETKEKLAMVANKDQERKLELKLDVGDETINAADAVRKRIEQKKSSFGKLHQNAVIDRRKK